MHRMTAIRYAFITAVCLCYFMSPHPMFGASGPDLRHIIGTLSTLQDRTTGSPGSNRAAIYISDYFEHLGFAPHEYFFSIPTRNTSNTSITIGDKSVPLLPLMNNAVTPQTIDGTLTGPLYYVGNGRLENLDRKLIRNSILLMDFDSGKNWLTAASLGAHAVVFVDNGITESKMFFREKEELSPVRFPCFWMKSTDAVSLFGPFSEAPNGLIKDRVEIRSDISWQNSTGKNIYCLIEGTDPKLKEELLIIEAFYDSSGYIPSRSPGADEAVSIANLLKIAEQFSHTPPARSVVLVATSGHAQSLHGMRDLIWSMQERTKGLRDLRRELKKSIRTAKKHLKLITGLAFPLTHDQDRDAELAKAFEKTLKLRVDELSRALMNLRLEQTAGKVGNDVIEELAAQRFALRKIGWRTSFSDLDPNDQDILLSLVPKTLESLNRNIRDAEERLRALESALDFRKLTREYTISAILSLHLSSHGEGIGGFHRGWLYRLRPRINRTGIFSTISDVFGSAVPEPIGNARYIDSLRPDRMRTWDSYFLDKPFLGGEISSLAGYIGVSLVTLGDSRPLWGTPWDTPERIDYGYLDDQFSAPLPYDRRYGPGPNTSQRSLSTKRFLKRYRYQQSSPAGRTVRQFSCRSHDPAFLSGNGTTLHIRT